MTTNTEQSKVWNEAAGEAWVTHADHFDATLAHFGEAAISRLAPVPGERVVDLGCGTGATTLRLAALVAPAPVVGVDLSHPMLAVARQRARTAGLDDVTFEVADVQAEALPGAPFDLAYSRFGVMSYSDPALAFRRIGEALVAGGRIAFVCFGMPWDNPFITAPVGAASQVLGLAPPTPGGPSPFSLADCDATTSLLTGAGFTDVSIEAGPTEAVLGSDDNLHVLANRLLEQNPTTSAALRSADPGVRGAAVEAAIGMLAPHATDGLVTMAAPTWIVSATKP